MWSQASISNLNVSIWVTDPGIEQTDEVKPVASTAVDRVKSVDSVEWAVPLYKGLLRARLANGDYQQITSIRTSPSSRSTPLARGTVLCLASVETPLIDSLGVLRRQLPRLCAARLHHDAPQVVLR